VGIGNWADAAELATTVGSAYADQLPDEPLSITGPGEESGTYDTYVELVIADIAEEQGIPEEEAVTRPDYTASADDNVIVEGIAGTDDSLGWVGFAFAEENRDVVREIEIVGEDGACVAPSTETIADGSYPLSRPLFIYVNADNAESTRSDWVRVLPLDPPITRAVGLVHRGGGLSPAGVGLVELALEGRPTSST
jgi:phosphate transport system substrate-binding protein